MVVKVKCVNCRKEYSVKLIERNGLCRKCRKVSDTTPDIKQPLVIAEGG
jgi:hypothetical protein